MASAPAPVLNDTAPQVNLWDKIGHPNFSTHTGTQAPAPTVSVDLSGAVPVIFTILFIIWVIYTLVVIYHWFRYRHKSWFAVPMIAVHLFVSGSLILFMVSGLK